MSIRDIPNSVALPQSAQMKLRPNAVPAVRKRLNIQPYQYPTGVINTSQLIQFYIPARKNTMYDPQTMYLRGRVSAVDPVGATTTLNRNAFSLINRLQVYGQDSTLLEDIQNYNDLCHTLMDIQMSREDKYALSTMYGSRDVVETATVGLSNTSGGPVAIGAFPLVLVADGGAYGANSGITASATVNNVIDNGVSNPAGTPDANGLRFCIPIVSAFGLLADTMIPTGWLNSDLRFDFYTETPQIAFRNSGGAMVSYSLADLELVVDTVEFDPASMAIVNQFAPVSGPLFCHASTYKNYSSNVAGATSGFVSTLVPHRSLSVKQILQVAHMSATSGQQARDSFSRVLPCGSPNFGIQLSVGGLKYPQKAVGTYAEAFAELQKSQHSFNQLILNGSINRTEFYKFTSSVYNDAVPPVAVIGNELSCKSVLGFDTEIYDKKGSTIINGQNWTGLNVFWEQNVSGNGTATIPVGSNTLNTSVGAGVNLQYFVNYDVIYVIQDGQISVRF